MKIRKRILSVFFTVLLICAMVVPASAAQHTYMGTYETASYEVVDNLYTDHFSSTTFCSESRLVHSNVEIVDENG